MSSDASSPDPAVLFGRQTLPVVLPEGVAARVIEKPAMPVLADPAAALEAALREPVGCAPLAELAGSARGKTACILICDVTRPVPNGLILPPLIRTLLAAGVEARDIVVLVATGLHRPNLGEELRRLVGSDWVLETVRVENHMAHDDTMHVQVGTTSRGTRARLDRRFAEADLRLVVGLVEPHFMAGYSGGRKLISPGIAHAETIATFHNARYMEDPAARNGNFAGNPLHGDQLEIVAMLEATGGPIFAVNTCLDAGRRLAFVNFGPIVESHERAVAFIRQSAEVQIAGRTRCVITSAAGFPLDLTYYQTIKGIVGALGALEPGGSLLIASECAEGLGSPEFQAAQQELAERGVDAYMADARTRALARVDEWQTVKLVEALRHGRIHLYTPNLTPEQRRLTGIACHTDWREAVAAVLAESGAAAVSVILEGPYVIPFAG